MTYRWKAIALATAMTLTGHIASAETLQTAPRWLEALDRGGVAVPAQDGGIFVSWRLLGDDPKDVAFDLYRDGQKLNRKPLTGATNFTDKKGTPEAVYVIKALSGPVRESQPVHVWKDGYLSIPVQPPAGGVTPTGEAYSYTAQDGSVGDLDGDGRYEIIVKWNPSNWKDNSQAGYTGPTLLDAYTLEGKRLWRIDLGRNIRSGSHYTQFQVFDYDGDGRAEIAMRTSDGTIDGTGKVLGDPDADWRDDGSTSVPSKPGQPPRMQGRIIRGPEYLTVFDGLTGKALDSAPYWPQRGMGTDAPTREELGTIWGDDYANRVDRFLGGTAYLDGQRPSIIMARGYYARTTVAAWDWRDGKLTRRWTFDSAEPGNEAFAGQGNHQLSVADVDNDGKDEILYGAMAIDDNGKGLWSSGLRHGDAMHVSDFDPSRPGLEKFGAHEEIKRNGGVGTAMLDARTGEILWTTPAEGDTGRGVIADIDPRFPGAESWAPNLDALFTVKGKPIEGAKRPRELSFLVWWDGDELRELFHKNRILKWDWNTSKSRPLLEAQGVVESNGTKNTPLVSGDLLGDWREEVIWHTPDEAFLRLYTTPIPTERRLVTLMHDAQYRVAVAWQNTAYNQPPHPSFFIGKDMKTPELPKIVTHRPAQ